MPSLLTTLHHNEEHNLHTLQGVRKGVSIVRSIMELVLETCSTLRRNR